MNIKHEAYAFFELVYCVTDKLTENEAKVICKNIINFMQKNSRMSYSGSDAPTGKELFIDSDYWEKIYNEIDTYDQD